MVCMKWHVRSYNSDKIIKCLNVNPCCCCYYFGSIIIILAHTLLKHGRISVTDQWSSVPIHAVVLLAFSVTLPYPLINLESTVFL